MSIAQLNEQLCFALYSASNSLTRVYRPLLEPLGLTYPQFVVMMALWQEDGVSITSLANKTRLSKATMTPLLKRLEQKQLIERRMVDQNERQKSIVLTEAGRKLALQSEEITNQVFCATTLSAEEANNMIELCHRIAAAIQS